MVTFPVKSKPVCQ